MSYAVVNLSLREESISRACGESGIVHAAGKFAPVSAQGTPEVHEKRSATMHAAAGVLNTDA